MKGIFIFLICLFLVQTSFSQKSILKRADSYYEKVAYAMAVENYEKLRGSKMEDPQMLARLANSYYQIGETVKAEEVYAFMIRAPSANYDDIYRYAMSLKENRKYEESVVWVGKFMAIDRADIRALAYNEHREYLTEILNLPLRFEVKNLDVNTNMTEFGGYVDPNTEDVYFVSNRKFNGLAQRYWTGNNTPFLDMFSGKVVGENQIVGSKLVSEKVNTNFHDGPLAFHPDGHKVFFTRNNKAKKRMGRFDDKGIQNLKLYYADIDADGKWSNIREVPYNNLAFSTGHPSFSKDGKTMYFSSDMPGGFGGADIYEATISEGMVDMAFGTPVNLGNKINTEGQEMFPWVDSAFNLFFSSDGHPGLGGLDNFVVVDFLNKPTGPAENLGEPINSNRDDFAFIMLKNGNTGYMSSNRSGGKGGDDIYSFKVLEPFKRQLKLKGVVVDSKTREILQGATVQLQDETGNIIGQTIADENGKYLFPVEPGKEYKVTAYEDNYFDKVGRFSTVGLPTNISEIDKNINLLQDPGIGLYALVTDKKSGEPIEKVKMKVVDLSNGKVVLDEMTPISGDILKPLMENRVGDCLKYQMILSKEGYLGKTAQFNHCIDKQGLVNIHQKLDLGMNEINVGMDLSKIIDISMIYFDLNKYNIRADAQVELAKIVQVMNDNPTMEIELGSHTDCRASYAYNENLSDKHAKASAEWVKARISNPSRIYGKGYGESRLVNDCVCEAKVKSTCSEEEHQLNRRTEFIIKKM
jgi:outer membrane protein OmpA-like peptidoglycan-associated protein/tetratricopeptide (TPR) repeat protein